MLGPFASRIRKWTDGTSVAGQHIDTVLMILVP
jgi:hypothetical protein